MDPIALLSRPEGKTLEFKRDLSSPEGVLKAIIAFANTSGGVVILGVEDGTRKVLGMKDVLAEEERLANIIADSISPKLTLLLKYCLGAKPTCSSRRFIPVRTVPTI
jgi:predicted HTH transcriptional regulator